MFDINDNQNIIPDARNVFNALRNSGYSNVAAIEDLMDNSVDAGANNIRITIDDLKKIIIADDGVGMSMDVLRQAVRLGGRKAHDIVNDLGKYGFGLITASISLGPRLTVITRHDGVTNLAIFDYKEIQDTNEFHATFREATETENVSFDYRTDNAKNGTVIMIDDCDRIQYSSAEDLVKDLKKSVRSVFRKFMRDDDKRIIINDTVLQYYDPLFLFDPKVKKRMDKTVTVSTANGEEELHIIAVTLPATEKSEKNPYGVGIPTQGFYALRNNREIAAAVEIPEIFKKHNNLNLLRIELQFHSGLDDEMGVNYTKHNMHPSSRIVNLLNRELEGIVVSVNREAIERQRQNRIRRQRAHNPFIPKDDSVDSGITKVEGLIPTEDNDGDKESGINTKGFDSETKPEFGEVRINTRFKSEEEALFDTSVSTEGASVFYNGKNPFYKEYIIDGDNGAELKKYLDIVVKSVVKSCAKNGIKPNVIELVCRDIASAIEHEEK